MIRSLAALLLTVLSGAAHALEVAVFKTEVTPPLGSPLCGGSVLPAQAIGTPLWARGLVLRAAEAPPVVLCAVDWVGIANASHDAWRSALAEAAGTTADRVAVHTLHQHDAPFADATTEALMAAAGQAHQMFDPRFAETAMESVAAAVAAAGKRMQPLTHLSTGMAAVEDFASNRRILGADGKVTGIRWTACKDAALRAEPVGTIDPLVRVLGLWKGETLITTVSWYATHPQSFYNTGNVHYDTVGMARAIFEAQTGVETALHFDGAGGNVGAGKYNDGAIANRAALAGRLADGMARAWAGAEKHAVTDADFGWRVTETALPARSDVDLAYEQSVVAKADASPGERGQAAREVAWLERCAAGHRVAIQKLRLGPADLVFMPGELFVEYQLAAQAMAPDRFVCMAAYGDYGPGYICTAAAYDEGGYEPQKYTSRTAPEVETVLLGTLHKLLD